MDRRHFETLLKRRSTRRLALGAGAAGLAGATFGLSLPGRPTRTYAFQATPAGSPEPIPVDMPLTSQPSATFGAYPFQLGVASGTPIRTG